MIMREGGSERLASSTVTFNELSGVMHEYSYLRINLGLDLPIEPKPTTEEEREAMWHRLREIPDALGLSGETDIEDIQYVIIDVKYQKWDELRAQEMGRGSVRKPNYIAADHTPKTIDSFLNGLRLIASLTGETMSAEAFEIAFQIEPDSDIDAIKSHLATSLRERNTLHRFLHWNMWAADRYAESPDTWPSGMVRQIYTDEIEQLLSTYPVQS